MVLATPETAARLAVAEGEVLVNRGNGFVTGLPGQELLAGDTVMIGRSGGKATISYEDACSQHVEVGTIVEVARTSPCTVGHQAGGTAPAGGVAAAGATSTSMIVVGAAAAAAAGLAIAIGSASGSSGSSKGLTRPASP